MVTLDAVSEIACGLPQVQQGDRRGSLIWTVHGRTFAWERQFSKADLRRFGPDPVPHSPVLAVRVADLGEKEAVLVANTAGFFTIPHFDGFSAILVELPAASRTAVRDALIDGWLACAPTTLADRYLADRKP